MSSLTRCSGPVSSSHLCPQRRAVPTGRAVTPGDDPGAVHSSLVGFVVGAFFSPEAYQYFPYFAVAYTTVLLSIVKEQQKSEARTKPSKLVEQVPDLNARGRGTNPKYVLR